jgi:hypothetical protein
MITLTSENATAQIDSLLEKYPDLAITEASSSQIRLRGSIHVYRNAVGFTVNHDYNIELLIPIGSDQLPSVYETGNNMDVKYQHRYRDGKLCLETDTAIRLRFYDGIVLLEWMDEFVEPYFFSYEYYQRFGSFPFGERPHGFEGMIDTYKEEFREHDPKIVNRLLKHIATHQYRGYQLCPCGSCKRLRDCHGKLLYPYMTDQRKQEIIASDVAFWKEDMNRSEAAK